MALITESQHIGGVHWVSPRWYEDPRGRFCESFRQEWFPERAWDAVQCNRSESAANILRGLHYHFHQIDYWQILAGSIEVGLVDLRRQSPTFLQQEVRRVDAASGTGLYIPPGVAHGFYSLKPTSLLYLVDRYYDGSDEFGVQWNDPELDVKWSCTQPLLSDRDTRTPRWIDIPLSDRPT